MKTMDVTAIATALFVGTASASDVFVGPDPHHSRPTYSYERHAEQFSFEGVRCVAKYIFQKNAEGGWIAREPVNCQE